MMIAAGRPSLSGVRGQLNQCSDQAQQCLLFRLISAAEELAQLNVG
jgi:hypothetical protein